MKKAMAIFATLLMALSVVGFAYATWSDTVQIEGTAEMGHINFGIHLAKNSIGAVYYGNPTSPLPAKTGTDDGNWDSPGQNDIDWEHGLMGPIVNDWLTDPYPGPPAWMAEDPVAGLGSLLTKDIGSTTITMSLPKTDPYTSNLDGKIYTLYKEMTITITNGYPDYITGASFCVVNDGSVPIELTGIRVVPGSPVPVVLEVVMLDYPVDPLPGGQGAVPGYDWGICFLTDEVYWPIPDKNRWQLDAGESWLTGIGIRVKQIAEECHTYTFTIKLEAQQWNKA